MAMNRLARSLAPLTIACCQLANVVGDAPQNTVSVQSPAAVPLTWEFAVGAPDEHLVVNADRLPAVRTPGYAGDEAVRRVVEPLVRERRLDVVLSGHSHEYEYLRRSVHGTPVHVLITGGAGGSLEPPQPESLGGPDDRLAVRHQFLHVTVTDADWQIAAVDVNDRVFDRVAIGRPREEPRNR